jgi:hypothetical protein
MNECFADTFKSSAPTRFAPARPGLVRENCLALDDNEGLGNGEQPNQRRNQWNLVVELEKSEGSPRGFIDYIRADVADHQSEKTCDEPLEGVLRGDGCYQRDAKQHDHDHLDTVQVKSESRQPGDQ